MEMNFDFPMADQADWSQTYNCIFANESLNTQFDTLLFSGVVNISQLFEKKDILLVDDLRANARWEMSKVIQRNISLSRVAEIAAEYLDNRHRGSKFFPAITCLLLPKFEGKPQSSYGIDKNSKIGVDGILVNIPYKSERLVDGYPISLKWDKVKIACLVIDGQHRVMALRSFYGKRNESEYGKVNIPVVFVTFASSNEKNELDLIEATRRLFIDVNNTPRLVPENRLIFIDDRNLHRRVTAKVFGAIGARNQSGDSYTKMHSGSDFGFGFSSPRFVNKYFVEDGNRDDIDDRGYSSNHATLFPWEFSSLMTVHENIIGNLLLSFEDSDRARDLRRLCEIIDEPRLKRIEQCKANVAFSKLEKQLKADKLPNPAEEALFEKIMRYRSGYIEDMEEANKLFLLPPFGDEKEDQMSKRYMQKLESAYDRKCSMDAAIELPNNQVLFLLEGKIGRVADIVVEVFRGLWFVSELEAEINNFQEDVRFLFFRFVVFSHENSSVEARTRDGMSQYRSLSRLFSRELSENDRSLMPSIETFVEQIVQRNETNLLRTIVGQEMLFAYLIERYPGFWNIEENSLRSWIDEINFLGRQGYFSSNSTIDLDFLGVFTIPGFLIWSEVLVRENKKLPGIIHARKGADLLFLSRQKVHSKADAARNHKTTAFNSLCKSFGLYTYTRLERDSDLLGGKTLVGALKALMRKAKENTALQQLAPISEISEDTLRTRAVMNEVHRFLGGIALLKVLDVLGTK